MQAIALNGIGFNLARALGPALDGVLVLFGIGWVAAASIMQAAAQLAAPSWVRARVLGIYQMAFNGALAFGSILWGWLGTAFGLQATMAGAAALAFAVRGYSLDHASTAAAQAPAPPAPEDPAPELASMPPQSHVRVLETMRYRVAPADRVEFLDAMLHVQHARGRAGALDWWLYEDVAHPDSWLEAWAIESWTDYLHEANRLSD